MGWRRRHYTDWRHLQFLIESNLNGSGVMPVEVEVDGKILPVERGLYHDNYRFGIRGAGLPGDIEERYLFLRLIPARGNDRSESENVTSLRREISTLQAVADAAFKFDAPRFVCEVRDACDDVKGFIETCIAGPPLSTLKNSERVEKAIRWIGQVAAGVHQLPRTKFDHLAAHADSRAHVLTELERFPEWLATEYAVASDAMEWIRSHLPERPSVVLHGDLLPQNILCDIMQAEQLALVDWEFARIGDPAYDLAIVTRGQRRVLGKPNAPMLLLDAYRESGGQDVQMNDIRIHEMILSLNWILESHEAKKNGTLRGEGPEMYARRLERLMRGLS